MFSYNLVDEKWIPCVMPDGTTEDFGLQEVLVRAPEIKELLDPSPLVTVSLHRLLLAILHRNFGPSSLPKWQELWNKGKWDENVLKAYFSTWRQHFNLFDDERPFYQSCEINGAEIHPVIHLALESASGNNATLFDHNNDDRFSPILPAIAAGYVITTQAFAIGFGKSNPFYFSDSPLIRGLTTMVLGNSLFETLTLNLVIYNDERPFPRSSDDLPVWEQKELTVPNKEGSPIKGYVDYLTWQSRRIHLFHENDMSVRNCQIQQNLKLPKQMYSDPFKSFRKDKERGLLPRSINPKKAVWRDSHILLQTSDTEYKRPEVFNWLARIDEACRFGAIQAKLAYKMMITGLATDTGKAASVLLWRHERLPLPPQYLQDENLISKLKEALELAEDAGRLLGSGFIEAEITDKRGKRKTIRVPSPLRILASELLLKDQDGKTDPEAAKTLAESLSPGRPYWAALGIAFNRFMIDLAADKGPDGKTYGEKTLPEWAKEIRKAARAAFEETARSLDRTGRMLKAISKAENEFKNRLYNILKPYINETTEGGEK
ncbi:MAG: type I-E CRISPR-associated protein Cse1/CasA [Chloroflexi bacterium RBG_16_50_9]|nr:MAG: type I-E CRISPR-associated protein Cse1/CasA [Chloroflexi bacterium RBG_16_50_9]